MKGQLRVLNAMNANAWTGEGERTESGLRVSTAEIRLVHAAVAPRGSSVWSCGNPLLDLRVTPRPVNARGAFMEKWGGNRFEKLGDIVLVPPGQPLAVRWDSGGIQSSIRCELRGRLALQRLGGTLEWTDPRLRAALDVSSHTVRLLLRRLAEEARSPRRDSKLLVESIATQLTIELCRYLESVQDEHVNGGLAAWRLRLIDERLQHLAVPPTLVELAELCSISVRQLTRGFLKSHGCTLGHYVQHHRMEAAKKLLWTEGSIKAVAMALDFSSTSSFAYAFRRSTGITPRQFQQRVLRSNEIEVRRSSSSL